jgi:hypothetical protein
MKEMRVFVRELSYEAHGHIQIWKVEVEYTCMNATEETVLGVVMREEDVEMY